MDWHTDRMRPGDMRDLSAHFVLLWPRDGSNLDKSGAEQMDLCLVEVAE